MQWNLELNLSNGSHLFSAHTNWTKIQIRAGADWGGVWRLIGVQLWTVARWPLQMRRHQSPINLIKPLRWPESHNTTVNVLSLSKAIALMVQCAFLKMRFFLSTFFLDDPVYMNIGVWQWQRRWWLLSSGGSGATTPTFTFRCCASDEDDDDRGASGWWRHHRHSYFYIPQSSSSL